MSSTESKYVSYGTYGCVMRPAYKCPSSQGASSSRTPQVPKTVAKLFSRSRHYDAELEVDQRIKALDPQGEFTLTSQEHCRIQTSLYPLSELQKCGHHTFQIAYTPQIIYPDGGPDLKNVTGPAHNASFEDLFMALEPVFKGLITLENAGIVHQDIKPSNIVYDQTEKKCKLIDFGTTVSFQDVFSSSNLIFLQHGYMFFPPEYRLISGIMHKAINTRGINVSDVREVEHRDTSQHVKNVVKHVHSNYVSFHHSTLKDMQHLFEFAPKVQNAYSRAFASPYNKPYILCELGKLITLEDPLTNIKTYANRVDVYMLGISILHVLRYMLERQRYDPSKEDFYNCVLLLITDMVRMNPRKRLTPNEAYQQYNKCIVKLNTSHDSKKRSKSSTKTSRSPTRPPRKHARLGTARKSQVIAPAKSKSKSKSNSKSNKNSSPSSVEIVGSVKARTPHSVDMKSAKEKRAAASSRR